MSASKSVKDEKPGEMITEPPYYAVIFTSTTTGFDPDYQAMSDKMLALARNQSGFLGVESARQTIGITVSYWKDLDSVRRWKNHAEHLEAQEAGRSKWYQSYTVRIAKVEAEYSWNREL